MPSPRAPYASEGGRRQLAEALWETYRYQIRCRTCEADLTAPGHNKDSAGKPTKDGEKRRIWTCRHSNTTKAIGSRCPRASCTAYILRAQEALVPTDFAAVLARVCETYPPQHGYPALRGYQQHSRGSTTPSSLAAPGTPRAEPDIVPASSPAVAPLSALLHPTPAKRPRSSSPDASPPPSKRLALHPDQPDDRSSVAAVPEGSPGRNVSDRVRKLVAWTDAIRREGEDLLSIWQQRQSPATGPGSTCFPAPPPFFSRGPTLTRAASDASTVPTEPWTPSSASSREGPLLLGDRGGRETPPEDTPPASAGSKTDSIGERQPQRTDASPNVSRLVRRFQQARSAQEKVEIRAEVRRTDCNSAFQRQLAQVQRRKKQRPLQSITPN